MRIESNANFSVTLSKQGTHYHLFYCQHLNKSSSSAFRPALPNLWLLLVYLSISISRSFLSIRFYQGKSRAHSTSVVVPSPLLHHVVQHAPDGFSVATPHIFSRCARFSLFWSLDSKAEPCRSVVNTFPFITPFLRDVRHSDFVKICLIVSSSSTWDKTAQWRCLHASESC